MSLKTEKLPSLRPFLFPSLRLRRRARCFFVPLALRFIRALVLADATALPLLLLLLLTGAYCEATRRSLPLSPSAAPLRTRCPPIPRCVPTRLVLRRLRPSPPMLIASRYASARLEAIHSEEVSFFFFSFLFVCLAFGDRNRPVLRPSV